MSNRLGGESSPYLQQHAHNPVWWFPWGDEAFAEAKRQDKPILLSVGYAACHWCHVMAHESFEDPDTAAMMNDWFINVKVDREERPDVDSIYMNAVVALTGQGGWPMTVMLTPEGEPFFGGTYFPPAPRYGMPSFKQVLQSVSQAWKDRREEIVESAEQITRQLASTTRAAATGALLEASMLDDAAE
ncbi:MAG: thioredoxin domain-containing protein, partial [Chloroflexota bacterium]